MTAKRDKSDDLTQKQDAFALAFFETGNAAEAYRRSYDVSENARDGWIYVEACQLLDNPKIARRLKELRAQAERHAIYTRQKAMEEYEEARALAHTSQNPSAAVSAINGKVKLWGLEAPIKQRVEHTGSVATVDPSKMSAEAMRELLGAMRENPDADQG